MHPIRYALIVSALVAAGAFYPHHNYNYFTLLKWMLFATSIWAAVIEGEKKRTFAVVVFCAVALIHNPFMRFHFDRNVWLVIDGGTAIWYFWKAFKCPPDFKFGIVLSIISMSLFYIFGTLADICFKSVEKYNMAASIGGYMFAILSVITFISFLIGIGAILDRINVWPSKKK